MNTKEQVKSCIEFIKDKFENNQYLFLSENDVVCQLYMKLFEIKKLSKLQETSSGQKTIALHTEVPFFSKNMPATIEPILNTRVDIAILKPNTITFDRRDFRVRKFISSSTKEYRFKEVECCIEVKLNKIYSKNKCLENITKDLDKLRTLNAKISFMFFLDKKSHFNEADVNSIKREYQNIEIIYGKPRIIQNPNSFEY